MTTETAPRVITDPKELSREIEFRGAVQAITDLRFRLAAAEKVVELVQRQADGHRVDPHEIPRAIAEWRDAERMCRNV